MDERIYAEKYFMVSKSKSHREKKLLNIILPQYHTSQFSPIKNIENLVKLIFFLQKKKDGQLLFIKIISFIKYFCKLSKATFV